MWAIRRGSRRLTAGAIVATALVAAGAIWVTGRSERNADEIVLIPAPGDVGCLKGSGGKPWIRCNGRVAGQYDVSSVAVSPDGRFVYGVSVYGGYKLDAKGRSTDLPGGTIVAFARDRSSGHLRQLRGAGACIKDLGAPDTKVTQPCAQTARGLGGAKSIVLSRDGRFAYVAALNNESIAAFSRDRSTGELRQLPGAGACVQDARLESGRECPRLVHGIHGVRFLALSPDGRNLYAAAPANDSIAAFRRDPRTGALTQLPGRAGCMEDRLARLTNTCQAKAPGLNYPRSLTVSPDGKNVYVASDSADASFPGDAGDGDAVSAFSRNPRTGALTQLRGAAACVKDRKASPRTACPSVGRGLISPFSVVVSPDGKNVYVGSDNSRQGAVAVFDRDAGSGALTQLPDEKGCLAPDPGCTRARDIAGAEELTMSASGRQLYVAAFFGLNVAVFNRQSDGALTAQRGCLKDPQSHVRCGQVAKDLDGPRGVTLAPGGASAYVPNSNSGTLTVVQVVPR